MLKESRDSDTKVLRAPLRATDNERDRERMRDMVIIIKQDNLAGRKIFERRV